MNLFYIFIAVMLILGIIFSVYCTKYKEKSIIKGVLLVVTGIFPGVLGIGLFPATMWRNFAVALIVIGIIFVVSGLFFIIRGLCIKK